MSQQELCRLTWVNTFGECIEPPIARIELEQLFHCVGMKYEAKKVNTCSTFL